jgi:hypothetical protein
MIAQRENTTGGPRPHAKSETLMTQVEGKRRQERLVASCYSTLSSAVEFAWMYRPAATMRCVGARKTRRTHESSSIGSPTLAPGVRATRTTGAGGPQKCFGRQDKPPASGRRDESEPQADTSAPTQLRPATYSDADKERAGARERSRPVLFRVAAFQGCDWSAELKFRPTYFVTYSASRGGRRRS